MVGMYVHDLKIGRVSVGKVVLQVGLASVQPPPSSGPTSKQETCGPVNSRSDPPNNHCEACVLLTSELHT